MPVAMAFLLTVGSPAAGASEWQLHDGGQFDFSTTFDGTVMSGSFKAFSISLDFDPNDPDDGALNVWVDMRAADMGDADLNAAIAGPDWFATDEHADAEFFSDSIRAVGDQHFVAAGTLRLKGVEQAVDVPFSWNTESDVSIMRGEFTVKRTAFNVGSGEWATGESIAVEVPLSFELEFSEAQ